MIFFGLTLILYALKWSDGRGFWNVTENVQKNVAIST